MAGTGLPIPQTGVLAQSPGVIDGDRFSAAGSWLQMARAGERLAAIGADMHEREAQLRKAGALADQENAIRAKATELGAKFRDDPVGFQAAWKGYSDGVLGSAPRDLVYTAKRALGSFGDAEFGRALNHRFSLDRASTAETIDVTIASSTADLSALGMRGELGSEAGKQGFAKLRAVLDSAVSGGLMTREKADYRYNAALGDAQAEATLFVAQKAYAAHRAEGGDALGAALEVVDRDIINNPDIPLSAAERRAYASKIKSELSAEEAARRQDLALARQAAREAQNAMVGGVRVAPDTIDSLTDQLRAAGDQAGAARLNAAALRADRLRDFGRLPIGEQAAALQETLGSAAVQTATVFLRESDLGLTPEQVAGIIGNLVHESRLNTRARNRNDGRDGSDSIGIAQWNGDRARALVAYANRTGGNASDLRTQLGFVVEELKTNEAGALAALRSSKTVEEATAAFAGYERPQGWSAANPRGAHGWENRLKQAQAVAGAPDLPLARGMQDELGKSVDR